MEENIERLRTAVAARNHYLNVMQKEWETAVAARNDSLHGTQIDLDEMDERHGKIDKKLVSDVEGLIESFRATMEDTWKKIHELDLLCGDRNREDMDTDRMLEYDRLLSESWQSIQHRVNMFSDTSLFPFVYWGMGGAPYPQRHDCRRILKTLDNPGRKVPSEEEDDDDLTDES